MNILQRLTASALIPVFFCSQLAMGNEWTGAVKLGAEINATSNQLWKDVTKNHLMYSSIDMGTYTDQDVLNHLGTNSSLSFICVDPEGAQCTLMAHDVTWRNGSNAYVIYWQDEIQAALKAEGAVVPGVGWIKVDRDSYVRLAIRTGTYKYNMGDNNDIDEKLFMCGVGAGGCLLSPLLGGVLGVMVSCSAMVVGCIFAFKAVRNFQNQVNDGEIPAPPQKAGNPASTPSAGSTISPGNPGGTPGGHSGASTGSGPELKCVRSKVLIDGKGQWEVACFPV